MRSVAGVHINVGHILQMLPQFALDNFIAQIYQQPQSTCDLGWKFPPSRCFNKAAAWGWAGGSEPGRTAVTVIAASACSIPPSPSLTPRGRLQSFPRWNCFCHLFAEWWPFLPSGSWELKKESQLHPPATARRKGKTREHWWVGEVCCGETRHGSGLLCASLVALFAGAGCDVATQGCVCSVLG